MLAILVSVNVFVLLQIVFSQFTNSLKTLRIFSVQEQKIHASKNKHS